MRHNEGQGKVQHAPDIVRASTTEPISALRSTIGSLWSAGCAWPRDRLNPDAASRSVVDVDRRLVVGATECLSLGLQTRRARPKSFLRRPPRARRRPSEPSCYSSPGGVLAWLAKNPATFGQHFPEIRWDSARSQGTVLLSVVWWSYLTWWL